MSWLPSEALQGVMRLPMDVGLGSYDDPPPEQIEDVEDFVAQGLCRFANQLSAWAEVEDGQVVASGSSGSGFVAGTRLGVGALSVTVPGVPFPELRTKEQDDESVTFVQSAGGRTGAPFPRRAKGTRTMNLTAPTAWTTLALTIRADGTTSFDARGGSQFPRHWFYNGEGELVQKSATIDFDAWTSGVHDATTPWGSNDQEILTAIPATSLERELSKVAMSGRRPTIRSFDSGETLMVQGEDATTMALVLDGLTTVDVSGEVLATCGPGSFVGERAFLEGGARTATVRAVSAVKIAEFDPSTFGAKDLEGLRLGHRRERSEIR